MNEAFNHWIVHRTPFVTVKAAMTLDGKIATANGESKWITGEKARAYGMKLRQGADAILVGINTVLADNPILTGEGGEHSTFNIQRRTIKAAADHSGFVGPDAVEGKSGQRQIRRIDNHCRQQTRAPKPRRGIGQTRERIVAPTIKAGRAIQIARRGAHKLTRPTGLIWLVTQKTGFGKRHQPAGGRWWRGECFVLARRIGSARGVFLRAEDSGRTGFAQGRGR